MKRTFIRKLKQYLSLLMIVVLLFQAGQGQVVLADGEDDDYTLKVTVRDRDQKVDGANVNVELNGQNYSANNGGNGVYTAPIVSENAVPGMYQVNISGKSSEYDDYSETLAFTLSGNTLSADVDISPAKKYSVAGKVSKDISGGEAAEGVQISARKKNSDRPPVAVLSGQDGSYAMNLSKGEYVLTFTHDSAKTVTKDVTVSGNDMSSGTFDAALPWEKNIQLEIKEPSGGTVTVSQNGTEIFKSGDDSYSQNVKCYYGDRITIYAAAKKGSKILKKDAAFTEVLPGREALLTIDALGADCRYAVEFAYNTTAVITNTLGGIEMDPFWGFMYHGTVEKNEQDRTVTFTPYDGREKYYPVILSGSELVDQVEYRKFKFHNYGEIKATFEEDLIDPEISISENAAPGNFIEGDHLYGTETITLNLKAYDGESGVKEVAYKLEGRNYGLREPYSATFLLKNYKDRKYYEVEATATDNVGNTSEPKKYYFYFDNEAPEIKSVSFNSATELFTQNGQEYVKGDTRLDVHVTDDLEEIRNIRYYVSDHSLSANELAGRIDEFTTVNPETDENRDDIYTICVDADKFRQGLNYVYVTAEDKCTNVQLNSFGKIIVGYDTQAPILTEWTDASERKSTWKKTNEAVKMNGGVSEELTTDGLMYSFRILDAAAEDASPSEDAQDWKRINTGSVTDPISQTGSGQLSNGNSSGSENTYQFGQELTFDKDGSYKVWVWVKDGCGNISEPKTYLFHVDGTDPGISQVKFDVKENGQSAVRKFALKIGNFFRKNKVDDVTETVSVTATINDETKGAYLDTQPEISGARLYYFTEEDMGELKNFLSDIKGQYALPTVGKYEEYSEKNGDTYTFKFEVPQNKKIYRMYVLTIDKAGNIAYSVPTRNGYGSDNVMVDQDAPALFLTVDPKFATPDYVEVTDKGNRNWYKKGTNVAYNVNAGDADAGLYSVTATVNESSVIADQFDAISPDEAVKEKTYVVSTSQGRIAGDGHFRFEVGVVDNAGNPSRSSAEIYIDENKPNITQIRFDTGDVDKLAVVPLQYGFFFKKATTVHVTATDFIGKSDVIGSGVKEFTYYIQSSDGTKTEPKTIKAEAGKDGTYTASFTIKKSFKGQVYVSATDNVGQTTAYKNPKGTVIESYEEHVKNASSTKIDLPSTSYQDEEGNPLYNYSPTITYTTSDTKSGICSASWSVQAFAENDPENKGELLVKAVFDDELGKFKTTLTGDAAGWKVKDKLELNLIRKLQREYTVVSEENHITTTVKMTDNVGHSAPAEKQTFSVDLTKPKVQVEYDNNKVYNEKYYNESRVATITVTDANFSSEDCLYELTGPGVEIGSWEHHAKGGCNGKVHSKECEWTSTVSFTRDGDYTFGFKCTDRAGWIGSYEKMDEFTIDKTEPEISVTYDNNDVRNGNYYRESRTATIRIEEHNFDAKDVEVTMTAADNGNTIAVPAVHGWTTSDDTNTATIAYDYDGEFTFDIAYKDLADNEAKDYEMDSFTVDLTEPELTITGVEDMSANNGEVIPVISCKDTNIDSSNIRITLSGANHGTTEYKASHKFTKTSADYTLEDLDHIKDMDDLYTLTATAVDKAGNEYEDSIRYSVNRFGSVYVLSSETQALVDGVYTNAEKDIRVQEINVDKLIEQTVTYSKESDIVTLKKGEDYTVTESGDEGSWKVYDYKISADNFESEGKYTVTLLSKDRATNASDNKAKGKDIEFVVDKTRPTVVLSGIEDRAQYTDDTRVVTIDTEDNIGMNTVTVYCDGKELAKFDQKEIEENEGRLSITLTGANDWQELSVVAKDVAGNQGDSDVFRFLLTRNMLVQWYRNRIAFFGTLAFVALLAGMITFLVAKKQKKAGKADIKS